MLDPYTTVMHLLVATVTTIFDYLRTNILAPVFAFLGEHGAPLFMAVVLGVLAYIAVAPLRTMPRTPKGR